MFDLIINGDYAVLTNYKTLEKAIEAVNEFAKSELNWEQNSNHIRAQDGENSFVIVEAFRPEIFIVIVDNKYVSTHKSEKSAQDAVQDLSNYLREGFEIEIRKSRLLG
jgi:hypothetical protein